MITIRIQKMLVGYKRCLSNTEQFRRDVSNIDKVIEMIIQKKNFYKTRNKFLDCIEIFKQDYIISYIENYHIDRFDEESLSMYKEIVLKEYK